MEMIHAIIFVSESGSIRLLEAPHADGSEGVQTRGSRYEGSEQRERRCVEASACRNSSPAREEVSGFERSLGRHVADGPEALVRLVLGYPLLSV